MKFIKYSWLFLLIFASINLAAEDEVVLQLKWTHAFQFAGYYAAIEQGYYQEAGLDVTILEATPESNVVRDVLDGKAQYGVGSSGLLLERAAGNPVVVLAVVFQQSPYEIYAVPEINKLSDLIGKRVMLEPHSEELLAFFKKAEIPIDRILLIPHSFDANSLIKGETMAMSGYVSSEPYYFKQAKFPYQTFSPRSAGIDFYGDNLFTSERELEENPGRVKAFRSASLKGWQYAKDHPGEIIDLIYSKYSQLHSRDYLQFESDQMIPLLQPNLIEIGYMNPNRWRHIASSYAEIGLLPADYPIDDFIYKADEHDLTIFYRGLGLALLVILFISFIAIYIYRVNRRLKHSMTKIQEINRALTESEKSYYGLFNSITEAIYIQDEGGFFIDVNLGVKEMYGYSREELIGKTPEFLSAENKNDLSKIIEYVKKAYDTGEPQIFEFWGKRKNGEIFPKEVICNRGKYFGKDVIVATARDITEHKQAEDLILAGRERLKMLNKIIRHDLANDFNVIHSAIKLFRRDNDKQILKEIEKRVQQSIKTISEYKNYEDFIDSNSELNEMELTELINNLITEFPGIKFNISGRCGVFADKTLYSVFTNLISNSIKHGNSTEISISMAPENDLCRIEFQDNGTGIPSEIKDKIFDEGFFYGEKGSTGLGLHIVKETIEGSGGSVYLEKSSSQGTTIIIKLRKVISKGLS